jgi:hypothetical protein
MAAFCTLHFLLGVPARGAAGGFGFMGIAGFLGLIPVLFKKAPAQVQWDERDLLIQRNANIAAYATFWVLFVGAAMIPWFVMGPGGTITVSYLAWMVFGGMFVVEIIQAIATLQQYGWTTKGEQP